jgi:RimJ/RimL family protein N-acetyltransferase
MLEVTIETLNLVIRDVRRADAAALLAYMQLQPYWRDLPIEPPTAGSIAPMAETCLLDQEKTPRTNYLLPAVGKLSGELIGEGLLRVRSARWRQGEIGWGIAPDRTGHGLGTEIGAAMLNLGFGTLGLHRIYAQCRLENHASRRIMAKLGMQQEGVLRQNVLARGEWWSSVQCSILATDDRLPPAPAPL